MQHFFILLMTSWVCFVVCSGGTLSRARSSSFPIAWRRACCQTTLQGKCYAPIVRALQTRERKWVKCLMHAYFYVSDNVFSAASFFTPFLTRFSLRTAGPSTVASQGQRRKQPNRHHARGGSESSITVGTFIAPSPTLKRRSSVSFSSGIYGS